MFHVWQREEFQNNRSSKKEQTEEELREFMANSLVLSQKQEATCLFIWTSHLVWSLSFFQWLDCNLTGVWLCGFLSCKNLSFIITNSDKPGEASLRLKEYYLPSSNVFSTFFQPYQRRTWRFTHRYVETSNMWKFRVSLRDPFITLKAK